jgi:hypothetical protein
MAMSPLYQVYVNLIGLTVASPTGHPDVDALIASTLGVSSLPYTSNDTDAQTLLPAGWSWSTMADGTIIAVRGSDSHATGGVILDNYDSPVPLPTPLTRCLAAISAQLVEGNLIS